MSNGVDDTQDAAQTPSSTGRLAGGRRVANRLGAAWRRIDRSIPTRAAAAVLFLTALGVFAVEALAWPISKGRDTWDYLSYYLELWHGNAVFPQMMAFRTPVTPIVVGVPMQLGGDHLLEAVMGVLYAVSIVTYSAVALSFGRLPALLTAAALLAYPSYASLFHTAASDGVFATAFALWALAIVRALRAPSMVRFAVVGVGIAVLTLTRPAGAVLLAAVALPLVAKVTWRRRARFAAVLLVCAVLPLAAWAVHNGLRYGQYTVSRTTEAGGAKAESQRHPLAYGRRVAHTFWVLLNERPITEPARRQVTLPPPGAQALARTRLWYRKLVARAKEGFIPCRSDYIDLCTVEPSAVWKDPAQQRAYVKLVRRLKTWNADLPSRDGSVFVGERLKRLEWKFPRPPFWLLLALIGLVLRRPRDSRILVTLGLFAGLVLLIHAAIESVNFAEYALPAYPTFILIGIAAVTGDRDAGSRRVVRM